MWGRVLKVSRFFPPGRRWVLRNLTTREYVYAHVLTSEDGSGGGPDRPDAAHPWGFTLGTVVAVNTCWYDHPIRHVLGWEVHGKWAGNRFDIVEERRLSEDTEGRHEAWADVSREERRAMLVLFARNGWDQHRTSDRI